MGTIKIVQTEKKDTLKSLTKILTVSLAVLTGIIILFEHDNQGITGYAVFNGVYGAASPFILVVVLLVIIGLYIKLHHS